MIVTFASQKTCGKDLSVGLFLEEMGKIYGLGTWSRAAFADKVKDVYCDIFNVTRAFIEQWKNIDEAPPGFDMPVRKGLEFLGNGCRQIQGQCWINYSFRQDGHKAFSDGRFVNELIASRERGGLNVAVWRPGHENQDSAASEREIGTIVAHLAQQGFEGPVPPHVRSDPTAPRGVDQIDLFLINDGTVEDLRRKISKHVVSHFLPATCAA